MNKLIKCPLCHNLVEYKHIIEYHKDYWINIGLYNSQFPETVKSFNKRFNILGFKIEE